MLEPHSQGENFSVDDFIECCATQFCLKAMNTVMCKVPQKRKQDTGKQTTEREESFRTQVFCQATETLQFFYHDASGCNWDGLARKIRQRLIVGLNDRLGIIMSQQRFNLASQLCVVAALSREVCVPLLLGPARRRWQTIA